MNGTMAVFDKDSRWSRWRKRKHIVANHMLEVSLAKRSNFTCDPGIDPEVNGPSDTLDSGCPLSLSCDIADSTRTCSSKDEHTSATSEVTNIIDRTLEEESDSDISSYYSPEGSSDEESDADGELELNSQLTEKLSNWAAESQIPHSKLRSLLSILRPFHPHLPLDPRTLLQTPTSSKSVEIPGGEYYHFGIANGIAALSSEFHGIQENCDVYLQINVDGLPIFKSSKLQFWPILGRVVMPFKSTPFLIGLFSGNSKPLDVASYFESFISEMKHLDECGGVFIDSLKKTVKISISCFICDAPARSFVKQSKLHNAYYGCDKCIQKGVWRNKLTFPETSSPQRTDESFDGMMHEEHHVGQSPLSQLSIGMVSQFPHDPMHLVYLGIVKRLLWNWMKGPVAIGCRIGANNCNQISSALLACQKHVPREFERKCRSLQEFERWKATEFRQFLLYSGVVVVHGKLPSALYRHFLLLFVAVFCLSSPLHIKTHCNYAGELLTMFVKNWAGLYGHDSMVYNVHSLVHLATDARKFGPLDSFSAFAFENFLGKLKKMVRKPHFPVAQVIRRVSEMRNVPKKSWLEKGVTLKREHARGPVLLEHQRFSQYSVISLDGIYFSTQDGDNCVKIGSRYGLIRNICKDLNTQEAEPIIVFEQFTQIQDFFHYPLNSSDLGIVKASHLSLSVTAEKASNIACKCFLVPYKEVFVIVPLLHHMH